MALYEAVRHVENRKLSGDLVECGVARGGSAALMALASKHFGGTRTVWMFDTFEGLPRPSLENPDFEIADLYSGDFRGDISEIVSLFKKLDVLQQAKFVPGLVEHTLLSCKVESIAVLHIDTDWYESVKACLENLYDRVQSGGIIQIDDYGHWEGARKAVDEFLEKRQVSGQMRSIDYSGRQILKG